jgi:hypothetical protein
MLAATLAPPGGACGRDCEQPLSLVGVVELPGLTQGPASHVGNALALSIM